MDRRVLFLAEPTPLLCEGESLLSTSTATAVARYPHNSAKNGHDNSRVGHDLRHLRRVLDDLSRFCQDQQQLTCITARKTSAGSSTRLSVSRGALCKAEVLTAAQGRSQKVGAGGVADSSSSNSGGGGGGTNTRSTNSNSNSNSNSYKDTNDNSSNSGSGSSSRRVLLAAVFPCPPPPAVLDLDGEVETTGTALGVVNATETREGGGQQQRADHEEPQRKLTLLAGAFAEVLDGCGVWLTPQDFEARVLVPTRALIDLQLGDRSSFACNDGDDLDGSAAAAAAATTADVRAYTAQTTGNGGDTGGAVGDEVRPPRRSKRRRCTSTPPPAAKSPKVSHSPMSPSATSSAHLGRHVGMEADGNGDRGGTQASTLPLLGVPLPEEQRGNPASTVSGDANNIGHGPLSPFESGVVAPTLPQTSRSPASSSPPSAVQLGIFLPRANPDIISVTAVNGGADCRAVGHGHGATGMAVMEEEFSRGAAEEIEELLRAAAAVAGGDAEMAGCPRSLAVGGPGGIQSEGGRLPRGRVLFDVVWAAASLPVGGPYCSGAQESPVRLKETPAPMCLTERNAGESHDAAGVSIGEILPNTLSRLTLSAPAGESRSAPLREALRAVCETFPESSVTIWPSNGGVSSTGFPASALTSAKSMGGARLGGVAAEDTDTVDCGRSERQSEGGVAARTLEVRRQWGAWCSSLSGGRLFFGGGQRDRLGHDGVSTGEDDEQNTAVVLEPGLLWRGPVVAAATVTPPAEAPSFTASRSLAPDQVSIFPALEGFALRVAACWPRGGSTSDGRKEEEDDDILRTVPGSTAAVSRAAAGVLARAPALRLSRVISPAAVARVCHLLADGGVAPALELYAYDAERFPGSAAFLEGWAADGRGMLLVAAAKVAEDSGCEERGATGASAARGEEGLAMACFPTNGIFRAGRERGGSGGESDAAVWSVTLFRRPSEFSEEAVAALVSGRGGCLEGSPRGPMARTTLQNSLRAGALVNGMPQGGLGYEVTEAVAAVGVGPRGAPEGLDLLSEGDRGGSPAAQSLRRSSRRARCRTNDDSLENDAGTKSSQGKNKGDEQTPAVGGARGVPSVGASIADVMGGLPVFTWQSLLAETSAVVAGPASSSASSSREEAPLASKDGVGNSILDTAVSLGKKPETTGAPTAAEVGVGPAMDACSAGQGACGSTKLASTRETRANKHLVGAGVSGEAVNNALGGVGRTASASSSSAGARLADPTVAAAYALYGSFGTWGGSSPDGARHFSWAEEALLPTGGNRQLFSTGETSGSRAGDATASAAPPLAASGGSGIDPRTAAALEKNKVVLAERGSADRTAGSSSSGVGNAAAAAVAVPPRRALSTAEEALEKAGHQQRARVKERRLVAREQRARMDRPRPRSRQGGGVGSSRAGAAGGVGGAAGASGSVSIRRPSGGAVGGAGRGGGGGGGGAFRRGGAASVPSSVSVTGRSLSGSKLSRGSLILGRSVGGVGAATDPRAVVAGGANAPGAGSGASVARAERGASGAGSGTPSAFGGSRVVLPPVNAGALSSGFGAAAPAAGGGECTNNSNKEKQPPGTEVPSSSRSSLSAADASRVRRAIFQDQQPPPVAPVATTNLEGATAMQPSPLPLASLRSTTSVEGDRRREEAGGDASTAAAGFYPAEAPAVGAARAAAVTAEVERAPAEADGTGASESLEVSLEETGQQQVRSARMGGLLAGGGAGVGAGCSLGGGDPMMRQVIERAMRSAVASQMGLPEGDSRVGDVFEREIRLMGGGAVGGGS